MFYIQPEANFIPLKEHWKHRKYPIKHTDTEAV